MRMLRRLLLGGLCFSWTMPAFAQATPPPLVEVRAGVRATEFSRALDKARLLRKDLERQLAPRYRGKGQGDDAARFVSREMGPWLTKSRQSHDAAKTEYLRAFAVADRADEKVTVLAEAGEMELAFSERIYAAGEQAMPGKVKNDSELRKTFLTALDDQISPMREASHEAFARCAELADAGGVQSRAASRCRTLAERPFFPRANGKVEPADLERRMNQARRELRRCYEDALKSEPTLAGELVLEIEIDTQGSSTKVLPAGALAAHAVAACAVGVVKRLRFPAPRRGKVSVRYPLTFRRY